LAECSNVCGLKDPRGVVKSMNDDDKEDYLCGVLIDSGASSLDLHHRYSDDLFACRSKRVYGNDE